jgi:adenylate cyclase 3
LQILDQPRFKDKIIKIKTIGSTYMAASGLNPQTQAYASDSMRERWRHLSLLVDFVMEMKGVLDHINEESYNQFFLRIGKKKVNCLRITVYFKYMEIGLNHGPVTAGVIGASKPAYDIWGNTVNVRTLVSKSLYELNAA